MIRCNCESDAPVREPDEPAFERTWAVCSCDRTRMSQRETATTYVACIPRTIFGQYCKYGSIVLGILSMLMSSLAHFTISPRRAKISSRLGRCRLTEPRISTLRRNPGWSRVSDFGLARPAQLATAWAGCSASLAEPRAGSALLRGATSIRDQHNSRADNFALRRVRALSYMTRCRPLYLDIRTIGHS